MHFNDRIVLQVFLGCYSSYGHCNSNVMEFFSYKGNFVFSITSFKKNSESSVFLKDNELFSDLFFFLEWEY